MKQLPSWLLSVAKGRTQGSGLERGMPRLRRAVAEQLEQRCVFASAGQLLAYDFNGATAWPALASVGSTGVTATAAQGQFGTIDTLNGTARTGAVRMSVASAPAGLWSSELSSGLIAVSNTETNLGKLTLGFEMSVSVAKPVTLRVYSYNAQGVKTGALEKALDPAAADYYQRYSVDFSTMTASGTGTFNPAAPFVSFGFEVTSLSGWSTASSVQVNVDNLNYSKPAYYVSPTGSDSNSGRTEQLAFKTPQKALDVSQPGDIILLMEGAPTLAYDYTSSYYTAQVKKGGTPAAWLVMKNYPGHSPKIYSTYWNAILIGSGTAGTRSTDPAIAYVEVRGMHVAGNAATIATERPDLVGAVDSRTNNNGISADFRYNNNRGHHVRIADNLVEYMSGGGMGGGSGDWFQFENNTVRNTSWWTRYATSGISILSSWNFDGVTTGVTRLVRNNYVSGNETFQQWVRSPTSIFYSDGNGIIIDINRNSDDDPLTVARGRTLVQSNVVFDNGGSGIHAYRADHVDIINNTAYYNSASVHLTYGQIFANNANDIRIYNNILVARVANTAGGEAAEPINGGTVPNGTNQIVYRNNLYSGGNIAPIMGTGDRIMDPQFINPWIDRSSSQLANYRVQPTSPAINFATTTLLPTLDQTGAPRGTAPDIGAYEYYGATPVVITAAQAAPVVNNTVRLGVYAADDNGPTGLTYTWTALTKPAGAANPTFTVNAVNAASLTTAAFTRAGNYSLQVNVADAQGNVASSTVNVTIPAVLSGVTIVPPTTSIFPGGSALFTAAGVDQFGQSMSAGTVAWSTTGVGNSIDSNGLLTVGANQPTFTVTVTAGAFSASSNVTVTPIVDPPSLTAVESFKTHGLLGQFSLPLALSGTPTVEPRWGGGNTLRFAFSKPIFAADGVWSANEFELTNASFGSVSVTNSTLVLMLNNVLEGKFSTVKLNSVVDLTGTPLSGTDSVTVGNLYGDVNRDGVITAADEALIKASLFQPVTGTSFLLDVDATGLLTQTDQRAARNRLGNLLS